MTTVVFDNVLSDVIKQVNNVLGSKAQEYATDDRLHNFKQAAHIQKTTPVKALGGMMAKHTVSVYDMIESDKVYPIDTWNEKIVDSINYLILLRALIADEHLIEYPQDLA